MSSTIAALRNGEVVDLEGLKLIIDGDGYGIGHGDIYVAERNSGPKLLTCERHDHTNGWIVPRENDYPYDTWECVKVKEGD